MQKNKKSNLTSARLDRKPAATLEALCGQDCSLVALMTKAMGADVQMLTNCVNNNDRCGSPFRKVELIQSDRTM